MGIKRTITPALSSVPHSPSEFDRPVGAPVGFVGRALLAGGSLLLLGGFFLAWTLSPSPRGYGTHQALGLPPCSVRLVLGIPCPACGMTTCFSNLMHGRPEAALRAHSTGCLWAALCAALIPWSAVSAGAGRLIGLRYPLPTALILSLVLVGLTVAEWAVRLSLP